MCIDSMTHEKETSVGIAYGFFHYAGGDSISDVLPQIREIAETPSELTLDLVEGVDNLDTENDSALVEIVQKAKRRRLNYALKATLPGKGNRTAANLLGDIISNIDNEFYGKSDPFYAGIVYKRGKQYVFRRD